MPIAAPIPMPHILATAYWGFNGSQAGACPEGLHGVKRLRVRAHSCLSHAFVPGPPLQGSVDFLRRPRLAQPVRTSRASAIGPPALSCLARRSRSPGEAPGRLR